MWQALGCVRSTFCNSTREHGGRILPSFFLHMKFFVHHSLVNISPRKSAEGLMICFVVHCTNNLSILKIVSSLISSSWSSLMTADIVSLCKMNLVYTNIAVCQSGGVYYWFQRLSIFFIDGSKNWQRQSVSDVRVTTLFGEVVFARW